MFIWRLINSEGRFSPNLAVGSNISVSLRAGFYFTLCHRFCGENVQRAKKKKKFRGCLQFV